MKKIKIKELNKIYGIANEIEKIFSYITANQSVSIIGRTETDRHTLLHYIYSKKEEHITNPEYVFLLIDFQERTTVTPHEFFNLLLNNLHKHDSINKQDIMKDITIGKSKSYYDIFESLVSKLKDKNMKLVLFFNRFDIILQNTNFDLEFFNYLRSLIDYDVAYVISSEKDLLDLCPTDKKTSPFWNIFTVRNINNIKSSNLKDNIEPSGRTGTIERIKKIFFG